MAQKEIIHELEIFTVGSGGGTGFGAGGFGQEGFGGGDAGSITATYLYGLFNHPARPAFVSKLKEPFSLNRSLPVPGQKGQSFLARTAQVVMSNNPLGDMAETPTVSYLQQSLEVRGLLAKCRIAYLEDVGGAINLTTVLELIGRIGAIQTLNMREARFPVAIEDQSLRSITIPRRTTLSVFPSADTSNVSSQDHPIIWVFGEKCLVELALVLGANFIGVDCQMNTGADRFLYMGLTTFPATLIAAGYSLEYDVQWDQADAYIALDLLCTDGARLKDSGSVDQNSFNASPTTDISAKCVQAFYRRRISLAALVGKTILYRLIGAESNANGLKSARIGQAVIVDDQGVVVRELITRNQKTFVDQIGVVFQHGAPSTGTMTILKINRDYFGAIRNSSGLSLLAVYRNSSVVSSAEYSFISFLDCRLVRFGDNLPQVDAQGKPVKILALLSNAEYGGNPANIRKDILADVTDGAGLQVETAAFTTAATDYTAAGITMGGGLDRQWALPDLLDATSYKGAHLWRNSNGQFQEIVDKAARYTNGPVNLEEGTEKSLNNLTIENAVDPSHTPIQKLIVRGYQYRGLSGQESWLLRTTRSRVLEGGEERTIDYPFLVDPVALDKVAHWDWEQLKGYDDRLQVTVSRWDDALSLALWHKVLVYAPALFKNGVQYFIREYAINGDSFAFALQQYVAAVYTYAPGTDIFIDSKATIAIDYSQTFPGQPGTITVGAATLRTATTGEIEAIRAFSANAPVVNVSHLVWQLLLSGATSPVKEIARACVPGATNVTVEFTLFSGNTYTVLLYARNVANLPDFRDGVLFQTVNVSGPLPPAPPPIPLWATSNPITATPTSITLRWQENAGSDTRRYRIKRATVDTIANAEIQGNVLGTTFTDTDFMPADQGKRFYYWLEAEGKGGLFSNPSTSRTILLGVAGTTLVDTQSSFNGNNIVLTTTDQTATFVTVTLGTGRVELAVEGLIQGLPLSSALYTIRRGGPTGTAIGAAVTDTLVSPDPESTTFAKTDSNPGAAGTTKSYYLRVRKGLPTDVITLLESRLTATSYTA